MKLTAQIKKGLKEFTKELCLKALEMHEDGYGGSGVAWELLPSDYCVNMTYAGDRLINTGRYIRDNKK